MIRSPKIKAVTMLEMLIVLAVSGIVVATAAKAYEFISHQVLLIQSSASKIEEGQQFQYVFTHDIRKAKEIYTDELKQSLTLKKDSLKVEYQFTDSSIIRKQTQHTDTFHIVKTSLELKELEGYEAIHLIGFIQLNAKILDEEENFVFEKEYSTETLLNLMPEEKP